MFCVIRNTASQHWRAEHNTGWSTKLEKQIKSWDRFLVNSLSGKLKIYSAAQTETRLSPVLTDDESLKMLSLLANKRKPPRVNVHCCCHWISLHLYWA